MSGGGVLGRGGSKVDLAANSGKLVLNLAGEFVVACAARRVGHGGSRAGAPRTRAAQIGGGPGVSNVGGERTTLAATTFFGGED